MRLRHAYIIDMLFWNHRLSAADVRNSVRSFLSNRDPPSIRKGTNGGYDHELELGRCDSAVADLLRTDEGMSAHEQVRFCLCILCQSRAFEVCGANNCCLWEQPLRPAPCSMETIITESVLYYFRAS